MQKLDDLLARLKPVFPNLPTSYKTLLNTPRHIKILPCGSGEMWYKGIRTNLDFIDLSEYVIEKGKIILNINMDGMPVSKSSSKKFWPILGHLEGTKSEPFIIAIYYGKHDPDTIDDFLIQFIAEIDELQNNGYNFNNINYEFEILNYILDAPARSLIKCCIGHNGYYACEKCEIKGEWHNERMTYTDLNQPLRTDASFKAQNQPHHHKGYSPL